MRAAGRPSFSLPLPDGRTLQLGARTLVMGILNVTPDSFSDGGEACDPDRAIDVARTLVVDGADIIDVGAESTRPGAAPVDATEEWRRLEPVMARLCRAIDVPVSIDTYKAETAERALAAGATLVNDISGLSYDPALADVVARRRAALVLMHNRGRSREMYAEAHYEDVVADVANELTQSVLRAKAAGVPDACVILDPGLGFAKRAEHTWALLARFAELHALGRPLLSGPSRKSFLTKAVGDVPPAGRVAATAAAVAVSVLAGAHIVRVHDVAAMAQVVRVTDAVLSVPSR